MNPFISQILSEEVNNTLNNDCPNASQAVEEKETWLHVFAPPIVEKLKKAAKGAKVTVDDIHRQVDASLSSQASLNMHSRLMALCPFETIAYEKPSPFCDLFTPAEWRNLEYYGDVEKYYKTGYVSCCPLNLNPGGSFSPADTEIPLARSKALAMSTSSLPA